MADSVQPMLVLGLGNPLLGDDGVGLAMLAELEREQDGRGGAVEFLDGGTQGLALLPHVCGRRALLVLDAVKLGAPPGTVHSLRGWNGAMPHASTAHESNAGELLGILALIGELPKDVRIVGIEPERVATSVALSDVVRNALGDGLKAARISLREMSANAGKVPVNLPRRRSRVRAPSSTPVFKNQQHT